MRIIMYLAILTAWKIFNVEPNGKDNGLLRCIETSVHPTKYILGMNAGTTLIVWSGKQGCVI